MHRNDSITVMQAIFAAIEQRNAEGFAARVHQDWKQVWPPSLPYSGTPHKEQETKPSWMEVWFPLQPSEHERRMDGRVVAANDDTVVMLWHLRGVAPSGERFDGEVLAVYQLRDGKLARAQMFPFDTVAQNAFLARAGRSQGTGAARETPGGMQV